MISRLLALFVCLLVISVFCGETSAQSNGIDVIPTQLIPNSICEGEQFKVRLSTYGGTFNADTKFVVRLYAINAGGVEPPYLDINAEMTAPNELTARYPKGHRLSRYESNFRVGIITQNPALSVTNNRLSIQVFPFPDFTIAATKPEISLGEEVYIAAEYAGRYPFNLILTNGQGPGQVFPKQTTTYTVKTYESGCGVIENPVHTPVTIRVRPSLYIAPLFPDKVRTFCEGQTVRLPFQANGVTSQTTYTIEAFTFAGDKFSFPGKVVGDSIEITIPKDIRRDPKMNYGQVWQARAVSANPALVSPKTSFKVQGEPFMALGANGDKSVPFPSAIRMDYVLGGGPPYELQLVDGTKLASDGNGIWFYQYIKKDTIFKAAALSNGCFRTTDLPSFPLHVDKPADTTPSVFVELMKRDFCAGDSVEVNTHYHGSFKAGNVFILTVGSAGQSGAGYSFQITRPGKYKLKLPDGEPRPFLAWVKLESSLPNLSSSTETFSVRVKPSFIEMSASGTAQSPEQMSNGFAMQSIMLHSTPRTTINYLLEGVTSKTVTDSQGDVYAQFKMPANKLTEFQVVSAENTCGNYEKKQSAFLYMKEYHITAEPWDRDQTYCPGTHQYLAFFFNQGTPRPGTRFTLEIRDPQKDERFSELATVTDKTNFVFPIPDKPAGEYELRVRSSDGILSNVYWMKIGAVPTARLGVRAEAVADTTVSIKYGSNLDLHTVLSGNSPWRINYSDGRTVNTEDYWVSQRIKVEKPATYAITKLSNSCGFGTAKGSVTVKVKPALKLTAVPANGTAELCPGQSLDVQWSFGGLEALSGNYLVFSYINEAGREIRLDSTQQISGKMLLKLPTEMAGIDVLRVLGTVRALDVREEMRFALSHSPDLTISGDNTIWAGQSTKIFVRANASSTWNMSFTLSDGATYTFANPQRGSTMELVKQPTATTTYTLTDAVAACGKARLSGSAVITVESRKAGWLTVTSASAQRKSSVCNNDTVLVYFTTGGTIKPNTAYTVTLSDSLGRNFTALKTYGTTSPLKAVIPEGVPAASTYRLRLTSVDSDVSASSLTDLLKISRYPRIKVLTPELNYQEGQEANVVMALTGTAPYQYYYRTDGKDSYKTTSNNPDTLGLMPASRTAVYQVTAVTNVCGQGTVEEPSQFTLGLVTALEPTAGMEVIRFGPNPTVGIIGISFSDRSERTISVYNAGGALISQKKIRDDQYRVSLESLSAGIYLIEIRNGKRAMTYRVLNLAR